MLSIDTVKALGVDMTVTKQDLIDIIAQELSDLADAELEAARVALVEATDAIDTCMAQCIEQHRLHVERDPKTIKLRAFIKDTLNIDTELNTDAPEYLNDEDKYWLTNVFKKGEGLDNATVRIQLDYPARAPIDQAVLSALEEAHNNAQLRVNAAREATGKLKGNIKRAQVRFIRELLADTDQGKQLLELLDAKTAKAGIRNLRTQNA